MFQNLIFDWSGTLVDDLGPVIEATNAVLEYYQRPTMDREAFRRQFRLPYSEFYQEVLPEVPLHELEQQFRPAFAAATTPVTILPFSRAKLEWCASRGIKTFVLTSMDPRAFELQLDAFNLRHLFTATYSGVVDKRKVIHDILSTHRLEADQTAFVGDMVHDIETARHGGITSIAVLTGYDHPEVIASAKPDITVPDLQGLQRLMHSRWHTPRPISTVGALIVNPDGNVLLVKTHKWSNRWGIPGGKIERGESADAALKREILEETGLSLKHSQFVMVQDCIHSPEFFRHEHFILLNYLAFATSSQVTLNEEAQDYRWLPISETLKMDLNQPSRILIQSIIDQNLLP